MCFSIILSLNLNLTLEAHSLLVLYVFKCLSYLLYERTFIKSLFYERLYLLINNTLAKNQLLKYKFI